MVRKQLERKELPQTLMQARPAFRHPGYRAVREDLKIAQRSRGFFGPRRGASGRDQGPRIKRSSIQHLKLRTRCARCRKLGHWAREWFRRNSRTTATTKGTIGWAMRSGETQKGSSVLQSPQNEGPFFLCASWTLVTLDPGEVLWTPVLKRDSSGNSNLTNGVNAAEHGLQVEWSQEKPESASGVEGVTPPIGVVYVPVGLAPTLLPVVIMRTLQASPDGWQLPEITELCQDNDEVCATTYMFSHRTRVQRPRCMDDDVSAGDHDPASTRSCGPRQKTTSTRRRIYEISSD